MTDQPLRPDQPVPADGNPVPVALSFVIEGCLTVRQEADGAVTGVWLRADNHPLASVDLLVLLAGVQRRGGRVRLTVEVNPR